MTKPIVSYIGLPSFFQRDNGSWYAFVHAIDHPRLGGCEIRTSPLVSEPNDEQFETLNSIYRRKHEDSANSSNTD